MVDRWGDPVMAVTAEYRARWSEERGQVVMSVTAFAANHQNKTWMDPRGFVADGLDASELPGWVPTAPGWYLAAVAEMALAHEGVPA